MCRMLRLFMPFVLILQKIKDAIEHNLNYVRIITFNLNRVSILNLVISRTRQK